jgi:type II secretory pathway pseudopilin PulG
MSVNSTDPISSPKNKGLIYLIIAIISVVVILAIVIILTVINLNNNPQSNSNSSQNSSNFTQFNTYECSIFGLNCYYKNNSRSSIYDECRGGEIRRNGKCAGLTTSPSYYSDYSSSSSKSTFPNLETFPNEKSVFGGIFADQIDKGNKDWTQIIFDHTTPSLLKPTILEKNTLTKPNWKNVEGNWKNIKDSSIGMYYTKNLNLETDKKMEIVTNQSWAKTKIFINDKLVQSTEHSSTTKINLPKGLNKIEIDFKAGNNNGHNIEFLDAVNYLGISELKTQINKEEIAKMELNYVGIYENKEENQATELAIKNNGKSKILVISSYDSAEFKLTGDTNSIKQIFIHSYNGGTRVNGANSETKITYLDRSILNSDYELRAKCSGIGQTRRCENKGFDPRTIETIFGKKPDGFSGFYNPDTLEVPNQTLTNDDWKSILKENEQQTQTDSKNFNSEGCTKTLGGDWVCEKSEKENNKDCVKKGEDLICGGSGKDIVS